MARIDGWAKVKGEAHYVADAVPRPCLYGALLVTTSAHCRVMVDKQLLAAQPGIVAVVDHTDAPDVLFTTNPHGGSADTSIFAATGRYPGDIVGAVAATSRGALKRALALVDAVEEHPLPAVLGLADGLQGKVIANEQYLDNLVGDRRIGDAQQDVVAAIASSPGRHESFVSFDMAPHGFMEPVSAAASWDRDHWRVWSPTQCPALVRAALEKLFATGCELSPVYVGGGFGGKEEMSIEPAAIVLAQACGGRTVLIESSRQQMTAAYRARHGGYIRLSTGFDADGRFLARDIDVVFEAGPYDGHSSSVAGNGASIAARLYRAPLIGARARAIATNRLPGGGFRGYGAIQAAYAVEAHVEQIAAILDIDAVELRLRNVSRDGDPDPEAGTPMRGLRGIECLHRLRDWLAADDRPPSDPSGRFKRGRGIGLLMSTSAAGGAGRSDRSEVACRLDPSDSTVTVETSVAEAGQGIYPLLARLVASAMEIGEEHLAIEYNAAEGGAHDPGMYGSRGANVTGSAGMRAGRLLRTKVIEEGALRLGVEPDRIELVEDWTRLRVKDAADELKISELPAIRVVGTYATADPGLNFGVQCADVVVDSHTGAVSVERVLAVHDVGVVQDWDGAKAQIEGAVVQGIGAALSERVTYRDDGSVVEKGFVAHLIPTCVGTPLVEVAFLDAARVADATGAKGLGEASITGVAAAIGNAIAAAVGIPQPSVPITPERLVRTIDRAERLAGRAAGPPTATA